MKKKMIPDSPVLMSRPALLPACEVERKEKTLGKVITNIIRMYHSNKISYEVTNCNIGKINSFYNKKIKR